MVHLWAGTAWDPAAPNAGALSRPGVNTELRGLLRPRRGRGPSQESGLPPLQGSPHCPPPAPPGLGALPAVGPPPPAAEVGQKPATPVPSALRLVPSQAVGPSGAAAVASLGALDLQTPPLCSTGRGHPRPQTHGAPSPPPPASGLHGEPPLGGPGVSGLGLPCRNARGSPPGYQGPTHGLCWAPSLQALQCPLRPLDSVIVSAGRSHSRMVGSASFMAAGEGFGHH